MRAIVMTAALLSGLLLPAPALSDAGTTVSMQADLFPEEPCGDVLVDLLVALGFNVTTLDADDL